MPAEPVLPADDVRTEIWKALLDGWVYTTRQDCAYWQMKRIEPILDRLLGPLLNDGSGCAHE